MLDERHEQLLSALELIAKGYKLVHNGVDMSGKPGKLAPHLLSRRAMQQIAFDKLKEFKADNEARSEYFK